MYNYKFFLSVVAFLGLLQQLLSLVQLGIHQLLLQIFVLHHFVYVLVGGFTRSEKYKCLHIL